MGETVYCDGSCVTTQQEEPMELSSKVELALGAIDKQLFEEYEAVVAACHGYAELACAGRRPDEPARA